MAKPPKLPFDVSDLLSLTPAHLRFIGEYCANNFDESTAFRKAYYQKARDLSEPEVRLEALTVLNNREVKVAIQRFNDSILGPYRDRMEHQIFEVYRNIAMADPMDFFNEDGSPKKLSQIPKEKRLALVAITSDLKGKDATAWLLNYKLGDRMQALKSLADIMGKSAEITDQVEQVSDDSRKRLSDIMAGVKAGMKLTKETEEKEDRIRKAKRAEAMKIMRAEDNITDVEVSDVVRIEAPVEQSELIEQAMEYANGQGEIGVEEVEILKGYQKFNNRKPGRGRVGKESTD
jgi:hypothetical protein